MAKTKTTPLRKCIISHEMFPKKELIRVVKTPSGEVIIDPTGKANGRGAYLRPQVAVYEKLVKSHALERALKVKITPEFYHLLYQEITENWD